MSEREDESVIAAVTEIKTNTEHMLKDMSSMKDDIKGLREGAPLHRIEKLEEERDKTNTRLGEIQNEVNTRITDARDEQNKRWRTAMGWLGSLTLVLVAAVIQQLLSSTG